MRVAVVQFTADEDKPANLARLSELVAAGAGAGATFVVAPEASMHGFGTPQTPLGPVAEPLDGPFVSGLAQVAREQRITVLAGMFERADDDARAYNTVVAIDPSGDLIGRYRKQHLFDSLGWHESKRLLAGPAQERLIVDCGELRVGVLTCYDVRFPELARALVDDGANVLVLPSAWVAGPLKEDQWATLVRARAIENVCYLVAADQSTPGYAGRSMVVDPFGVVVASLGEGDGVAVADIERSRIDACRARMPSLDHRRWTVAPRG